MRDDRSFKASDVSGPSVWIDPYSAPFRLHADFRLRTSDFTLRTSHFGLQTSHFKHWFRASLIANIAFAKLANISGTVKAIQTKVKNGKNDLDCTAISIKFVSKQSAKAEKSNASAKGLLGIAKKIMIFLVIKK